MEMYPQGHGLPSLPAPVYALSCGKLSCARTPAAGYAALLSECCMSGRVLLRVARPAKRAPAPACDDACGG
jgi:hypothetical protein